ncbi:hypothetical protein CDAR_545041 [Caerostris darwini]|uniref:Uncharacterized protein n=1 Tax=Caerostris darwini TaxID=1538125 RepID=A0AAV4PS81_9ARAC|nr:hypothetical protein CDAR_545041 [Caerostris darwini]
MERDALPQHSTIVNYLSNHPSKFPRIAKQNPNKDHPFVSFAQTNFLRQTEREGGRWKRSPRKCHFPYPAPYDKIGGDRLGESSSGNKSPFSRIPGTEKRSLIGTISSIIPGPMGRVTFETMRLQRGGNWFQSDPTYER